MLRIFLVTALAWLSVATLHGAQEGGVAAVPGSTEGRATSSGISTPQILQGTRADVFSTIEGRAVSSTNDPVPNAIIRLRDACVGQIVATQVTDSAGFFAFRSLDPGSYVVEWVDGDQDQTSVLDTSQVLNVGASETVFAILELPSRVPIAAGFFGSSMGSALAVTSLAAAAGILATQVSGAATCETLR